MLALFQPTRNPGKIFRKNFPFRFKPTSGQSAIVCPLPFSRGNRCRKKAPKNYLTITVYLVYYLFLLY